MKKSKILFLGLCFLVPGCTAKQASGPVSSPPVGPAKPVRYEVYQEVLNKYVSRGLIKYKSLKENPHRLEEFLASLAAIGPKSTPGYFSNPSQELAFWINVYNAAGLRAGSEKYPATSVRPLWVSFEDATKINVDGQILTLRRIGDLARYAGKNDPRIDLALILPAKGSGQFPGEVYLSDQIDRQLTEAVHRAMSDPTLFEIDHKHWALRLGKPLYQNQKKYIAFYEKKLHTENATILNALGWYADSGQRNRLNSALDYRPVEIPFDWSLNVFDEPSCTLDNYR